MAKRTYVTMMSLFFILSLSACPSEKDGKIEGNIFESYEVNQNLQRYAVKTETEQIIKMDEQGNNGRPDGGIPIHSTIEAFHQTIETRGQEKEQYYSNKGLSITNPTGVGWVKTPVQKSLRTF